MRNKTTNTQTNAVCNTAETSGSSGFLYYSCLLNPDKPEYKQILVAVRM